MKIQELFKREQSYWRDKNISFFGVDLLDFNQLFNTLQNSLNKSCKLYWNVDKPCRLAQSFNDGKLDKDYELAVKNTYRLELNPISNCIDIYRQYRINNELKELQLGSIPSPEVGLTWRIYNSSYALRVTAARDYRTIVSKKPNSDIVLGEGWQYDIKEEKFTFLYPSIKDEEDLYNNYLSKRSRSLLQSRLGKEKLTFKTFKKALSLVPEFKNDSIFNFKFSRFEYYEDLIFNSKKYATPTKNILLGINSLFNSKTKKWSHGREEFEGQLILSYSDLFALENFRTVSNVYTAEGNKFIPSFTFGDSLGFFDVFKTVTSRTAGRQRLLCDNILIYDGQMFVSNKKEDKSMFEYIDNAPKERLSCLSYSPFCNNNKAKRLMMTAKMRTQAVTLKDEEDSLTHILKARVLFADLEGYNYGDSIVISKSFADKLRCYEKHWIILERDSEEFKLLESSYKSKGSLFKLKLNMDHLKIIFPNTADVILDSYENVVIDNIEYFSDTYAKLFISYEIPFRLGDKLSNFHGAKGTVGLILDDDKMPQIKNDVTSSLKKGPVDIIISGFAAIRRGSLGQLFEAWMYANELDIPEEEQYISKVSEKYYDNIKQFAENSIVEYNGKELTNKAIGIIDIIRLHHHAVIHSSESSIDNSLNRMLKIGEMEKFNLLASSSENILKELAIRSVHKYINGKKLCNQIEETGNLPSNLKLNLRFTKLLKSLGYDILVDDKPLVDSDYSTEEELLEFDNLVYKK